jgi:hypothetical protein
LTLNKAEKKEREEEKRAVGNDEYWEGQKQGRIDQKRKP